MLDKKHGYGIYDWGNGYIYKGAFIEDQRSGQGELYYNGEIVYDGHWINGERLTEIDQTALNYCSPSPKKKERKSKSKEKLKKVEESFLVNFKHLKMECSCSRRCFACKSKEKGNKKK